MGYLDELNDVQKAAVTTIDGPILVIAGPGSGKTRVLTYRIAYLLEQGVSPWNILSLTFTNKAAREMKERIENVVGDKVKNVWAGTFHSIFARILRYHADKLGYPKDFVIYDAQDSKNVIKAIVSEMSLDPKIYAPNAIAARISSAKTNLIAPSKYELHADLMEEDRAARRPYFYQIYKQYMARNHRSGAMDFDDLLYFLYWLFRKEKEVLLEYRNKFKYVLVDEFQDTNFLQYSILKQLVHYEKSPANICVVGDDAQSIYAFRGATIDNIFGYEKDFKNVKTFKLEQNYRSTNYIVQAANEIISYNSRQIKKDIWTDKMEGNKIKLIKTSSDAEEAKRVVDTILEQKNRNHLKNSEIAILYRTNAQSRVFEEYFRRYDIAYRIYGGLSFYQRKEVKDLVAYLKLTINPKDGEAFRRVVNYPKRGIGKSSLDKLAKYANEQELSLWEAIDNAPLPARAKDALLKFKVLIKGFQKKMDTIQPSDLARFIFNASGLRPILIADNTPEGVGRIDNINSLLDGIKAYEEEDSVVVVQEDEEAKTLTGWLQNISLLTDADKENESSDVVTLMSVHAAKGLEFKSVFVTGMEEKLFPSFMSMESKESMDEERRLFYVAVTRAEQYLTLTYAESRYKFGQMTYNAPSRFLEEISSDILESNVVERPTRPTSTVQGAFKPYLPKKKLPKRRIPNFKPSSVEEIKKGATVMHEFFGKGKVLQIDGTNDKKVATVYFKDMEKPERRLMLRFAKLQVLS
ncbi:MAG TPA: ATP-dependent DNA helicase [Saprospiraceae bacterium]|nr:ATP-dependent DNA helicase [Saprospiraceae bacterium]